MPRKMRAAIKEASVSASSALKNKIYISWKNFIVFLVLFIVSFVLYEVSKSSQSDFFANLFGVLSIIFGFLSLALLIVLAVFLILRSAKK